MQSLLTRYAGNVLHECGLEFGCGTNGGKGLVYQCWSIGSQPVADWFFVGDNDGHQAVLEGIAVDKALTNQEGLREDVFNLFWRHVFYIRRAKAKG